MLIITGMFYSVKPNEIFKYKVYYMEYLYKRLLPENSKKVSIHSYTVHRSVKAILVYLSVC